MFFRVFIRWLRRPDGYAIKLSRTLVVVLILNLVFGTLFWLTERGVQDGLTWIDSVWWAMVTMTTVGYGDYFPQTTLGRYLVGYPAFILGIGVIGYLLGQVGEMVLDRLARKRKGLMNIKYEDHIIICHCPALSKVLRLVEQVRATPGHEEIPVVVLSDELKERPRQFIEAGIDFVQARPTSEAGLQQANVTRCRGVLILARNPGNVDSDAQTFAVGTIVEMIEREVGHQIQTVAELVDRTNLAMMERTKVDGCIISGGLSDRLLAQELFNPGLRNVFEELITSSDGCQLFVLPSRLTGSRLVDVQTAALQVESPVQVIGLVRAGQTMVNPPRETKLEANDGIIVLAETPAQFSQVETAVLTTAS